MSFVSRGRAAQACCVLAVVAMALPWHTGAGLGGTSVTRGIGVGAGRVLILVCIATILLIQRSMRPAWIGAGFAAAIAARELVSPSGAGDPSPGLGAWIAAAACATAAVLLVWNLFIDIRAGDSDGPPRGLSGPLGRRQ